MDGVINIYKERGFTSHDVVAKLRGVLRQEKSAIQVPLTLMLWVCFPCVWEKVQKSVNFSQTRIKLIGQSYAWELPQIPRITRGRF